jgi:hypothetical protein
VAPFYILLGPMMCGIYLCLLRRHAGQRVSFEMLFKGFDYFVQGLIATLIMVVPVLLVVAVFYGLVIAGAVVAGSAASQSPGQPTDPTFAWIFGAGYAVLIVGLILVSMLFGTLFAFTFPLIVDRGLSGWEAAKLSARAALANLGGLVGLMLLSFLLGLLGVLACYVGVIFVYPLSFAMTIVAYRQVFGPEGSVLFEPPPPNWPAALEPVPRPEQTGIQGVQDSPIAATKPPEEPGITSSAPPPGEGRTPE